MDRQEIGSKVLLLLNHLAGVCDGAADLDGVGFNACDSEFGRSLAKQSSLSDRQLLAAAKMLQKYRSTQLAEYEVPSILDCAEVLDTDAGKHSVVRQSKKSLVLQKKINTPTLVEPVPVVAPPPPVKISMIREQRLWLVSVHRVGLSEQQQEAFDAIHEWFFGEAPVSFVLKGYSGTGKTYTVQRIVKSIQDIAQGSERYPRFKAGLCAPTHKAVEVLEGFASREGLMVQVNTIHSFLHVAPGEFEEDGRQKLTEVFSSADHYSSFDLMVVDESSMIGSELLQFVPSSVPTLYMGDPAQLPPVTPDEKPTESPVFGIEPSYQLTHVMRYDGGILALATEIRNNLDSPHCPPIPRMANNLIKLSCQAWESELLAAFNELDFAHNPNAVRAIAYRNVRVEQLNKLIRQHLYPDAVERYEPGEILMANEPVFTINGDGYEEILLQTCQECVVESVEHGASTLKSNLLGETVEVETLTLFVSARGVGAFEVKTLRTEADDVAASRFLDAFKNQILLLGKDQSKQEQKNLRKSHWVQYFWLLKDFNIVLKSKKVMQRLQYAYCLTIHKSQGSTIDNVFADFRDIHAARDNRTKNQLRYVALTRAAQGAYILY